MLGEQVLREGDAAEHFPGATVRLVGGGEAVAPDDDPRLDAFRPRLPARRLMKYERSP